MKTFFACCLLFIGGLNGVCYAADVGPRVLKVKGLYLGMNIEEAKSVVEKLFDKSFEMAQVVSGRDEGSYRFLDGERVSIRASEDRKVDSIQLYQRGVNILFNAYEYSSEEFKNAFSQAYNLSPFQEIVRPYEGWEFTSPNGNGYKVRISKSKDLTVLKVVQKGRLMFD